MLSLGYEKEKGSLFSQEILVMASVSAINQSINMKLNVQETIYNEKIGRYQMLKKKAQKYGKQGHLGGSAVKHLPSAQGMILECRDQVLHLGSCMEPASPSPVSLPLSPSVSHE